jgi:3'(2'), 5'-bisphosphate nucleotidase
MSLIFNEKPIFGLIYAPIFEGGKLFYNNQKKVFLRKNNQETLIEESLNNKNFSFKNKVKIITSKRSTDEEIRNFFCNNSSLDFNKIEIQKLSSAVKFFKILEGESDIYIHFKPTMEWDVAAGNFLVELIGRKVKNIKFNESGKISLGNFCYHKRDFKNKPFIISQNWNFLN